MRLKLKLKQWEKKSSVANPIRPTQTQKLLKTQRSKTTLGLRFGSMFLHREPTTSATSSELLQTPTTFSRASNGTCCTNPCFLILLFSFQILVFYFVFNFLGLGLQMGRAFLPVPRTICFVFSHCKFSIDCIVWIVESTKEQCKLYLSKAVPFGLGNNFRFYFLAFITTQNAIQKTNFLKL